MSNDERDDLAETLRLRSEALNRVAEENEALRARLAKVEALAERPAAAISGTGGHIEVVLVGDLRAALADQEAP